MSSAGLRHGLASGDAGRMGWGSSVSREQRTMNPGVREIIQMGILVTRTGTRRYRDVLGRQEAQG